MSANTYSFTTHWHVSAPPDLVSVILADATALPRWWPAVYLEATLVAAGALGQMKFHWRLDGGVEQPSEGLPVEPKK